MKPRTFQELFKFYYDYVKVLYAAVQAENNLPQETLFEINAAFDHLSRHWAYGHDEAFVVEKVYSHLKRGCLDIFKIFLVETVANYDDLKRLDTSIIDNGDYDKRMRQLMSEIKKEARDARRAEGRKSEDDVDEAFEIWSKVLEKCDLFNKDFYLHPGVDWARRKSRIYGAKSFALAILASLIAGVLISPAVLGFFRWLLSFLLPVGR